MNWYFDYYSILYKQMVNMKNILLHLVHYKPQHKSYTIIVYSTTRWNLQIHKNIPTPRQVRITRIARYAMEWYCAALFIQSISTQILYFLTRSSNSGQEPGTNPSESELILSKGNSPCCKWKLIVRDFAESIEILLGKYDQFSCSQTSFWPWLLSGWSIAVPISLFSYNVSLPLEQSL